MSIILATWEANTRGLQIQHQPGQLCETCHKIKFKKRAGDVNYRYSTCLACIKPLNSDVNYRELLKAD